MEKDVIEFDVWTYNKERPIIIYGAGIYGEYTLAALKVHNICPICFCDREDDKQYLGLDVYNYKKIREFMNPIVLLSVGAQFQNVLCFLTEKGIEEIYSVYSLIFQDTKLQMDRLSLQAQDIQFYEQLYLFGRNNIKNDNKLKLYSLDWVITQRCSLRCRDCSNLMQYYTNPANISKTRLIHDLDRVLEAVDEIMDLRVIGGEPFMNPDMAELMGYFLDVAKIRNFSIYTNATILPNDRMLKVLKNRKVKCEITDYGDLAKNKDKFIQLMENEHVRHHVVVNDYWHKLGPLADRKHTVEEMKRTFSNCYCNDLITLLNGKLYRCPYSAHGRELGAIPYKTDDVVELDSEISELRTQIRELVFNKEFDYACGFCDGRNPHLSTVTPAIQIEKPLPYLRCGEIKDVKDNE